MNNQPLNIGGILRGALDAYKKHTGMLTLFALVNALFTLFLNASAYIMELGMGKIDFERLLDTLAYPGYTQSANPEEIAGMLARSGWMDALGLLGAGALLFAAFLVFALTLVPKNQLAMQFYIASGENGKLSFKESYAKTKGKVGGLVGNAILLGVILGACMIPAMLVLVPIFVFTQAGPAALTGAIVPVMMAAMAIVCPWFFLLAPAAAFENGGNLLGRISRMKKGSHWRVVTVSLATLLPGAVAGVLALAGLHTLAVAGISAAVNLFAFGFSGAAQALTYQSLAPPPARAAWEWKETPGGEQND